MSFFCSRPLGLEPSPLAGGAFPSFGKLPKVSKSFRRGFKKVPKTVHFVPIPSGIFS
jgi:hypothetical protein